MATPDGGNDSMQNLRLDVRLAVREHPGEQKKGQPKAGPCEGH